MASWGRSEPPSPFIARVLYITPTLPLRLHVMARNRRHTCQGNAGNLPFFTVTDCAVVK